MTCVVIRGPIFIIFSTNCSFVLCNQIPFDSFWSAHQSESGWPGFYSCYFKPCNLLLKPTNHVIILWENHFHSFEITFVFSIFCRYLGNLGQFGKPSFSINKSSLCPTFEITMRTKKRHLTIIKVKHLQFSTGRACFKLLFRSKKLTAVEKVDCCLLLSKQIAGSFFTLDLILHVQKSPPRTILTWAPDDEHDNAPRPTLLLWILLLLLFTFYEFYCKQYSGTAKTHA